MPAIFRLSCLFIILSFLSSTRLLASPQVPDYIIYKNDTIVTYNLILERYLQTLEKSESARLFGLSFRNQGSFSCWRGYQAIYKIDNDSLLLVGIISCGELRNGQIDQTASIGRMKTLFNDKLVNDRVNIDWFSGNLNFPLNNKILRWDGIFYKIYEAETVITIADGKVLSTQDADNYIDDPKAIDRRDKTKVPGMLFKRLKKVKWKKADDCDCSDTYEVTINEEGNITKVAMADYQTEEEINKYWDRKEYDYCINNMLRALRKLKFDIVKDKGKPISETIYLRIWITEKGKIENWTN